MKRMLYVTALLLACVYALPLLTLGRTDTVPEPSADPPQAADQPTLSFDRQTTITLHTDQSTAQTLDLHTYLCGVVAAEMPASFPEEALKAQALAARTYTLYQLSLYEEGMTIPETHGGAQLCSDPTHCKAYCDLSNRANDLWGSNAPYYTDRITRAVEETDGIIATFEGKPIAAVFHSTSGESTESALSVWGSDTPYLVSVQSPGSDQSPKYHGEVILTQADFKERVLAKWPSCDLSSAPKDWFKASQRSEAGGIIEVAVGGVRVKGTELRQVLGLNSTNFTYTILANGDLSFKTTGYGHGVGMSQYGARALAEEGKTFEEIIRWYYTGVDLTDKSKPA